VTVLSPEGEINRDLTRGAKPLESADAIARDVEAGAAAMAQAL
jgi:hypothetical protein